MISKTVSLFCAVLIIGVSYASDRCQNHHSCSECVKASSECHYCTSQSFQGAFRCDSVEGLVKAGCADSDAYTIKSTVRIGFAKPGADQVDSADDNRPVVADILEAPRVIVSARPGAYSTFMIKYQHQTDKADIILLHSSLDDKFFKLMINVNCHGKWDRSLRCAEMKKDETVHFKVDVMMDEDMCTKGNDVATVGISGVGKAIGLYLFPLCGCECEKPENVKINANQCNERGNLTCGHCSCKSEYSGQSCTQEGHSTKPADRVDMCTDRSGKVCNGRGSCESGRCVCTHKQITGRYCECDNANCPRTDKIMCNGHGQCNCGSCNCEPEWSGLSCQCSQRTDQCTSRAGVLCSNHGQCICNRCSCAETYSGVHCETAVGPVPHPHLHPDSPKSDADVDDSVKGSGVGGAEEEEMSQPKDASAVRDNDATSEAPITSARQSQPDSEPKGTSGWFDDGANTEGPITSAPQSQPDESLVGIVNQTEQPAVEAKPGQDSNVPVPTPEDTESDSDPKDPHAPTPFESEPDMGKPHETEQQNYDSHEPEREITDPETDVSQPELDIVEPETEIHELGPTIYESGSKEILSEPETGGDIEESFPDQENSEHGGTHGIVDDEELDLEVIPEKISNEDDDNVKPEPEIESETDSKPDIEAQEDTHAMEDKQISNKVGNFKFRVSILGKTGLISLCFMQSRFVLMLL